MKISSLGNSNESKNWKSRLRPFLRLLPLLAYTLLVTALARPQDKLKEEKITTEGIDIIISMDISGSMLARDFQPDRLEAAKKMAEEFIKNRPNDRIGVVVFSGESFTQCPITSDHGVLKRQMREIKSGMVEHGTAIGMGVATAVNRLKESKAESKVVILLTDGENNSGFIDPVTAAETAREYNIKVYTIGVGTTGTAPFPSKDLFGRTVLQQMEVKLDEDLLTRIADITSAKYFRATNNNSLRNIYKQIDTLEKTEVQVTSINRFTELFRPFVSWAIALLIIHLFLRHSIFRGL